MKISETGKCVKSHWKPAEAGAEGQTADHENDHENERLGMKQPNRQSHVRGVKDREKSLRVPRAQE